MKPILKITVSIILILCPQWTDCKIRKPEKDTFHVVSAGYGVQSENNTSPAVTPSNKFRFQARRQKNEEKERPNIKITRRNSNESAPVNHQDQSAQPSLTSNLIYQVHEKNPEVQEKTYQVDQNFGNNRPNLNEIQNVVNQLESNPSHMYGRPPKDSTIVEVVRVPAIYELHLKSGQNDPQRFVTLNPWLNKQNGFMQNNAYQIRQPMQSYFPTKTKFQSQQGFNQVRTQEPEGFFQAINHILQQPINNAAGFNHGSNGFGVGPMDLYHGSNNFNHGSTGTNHRPNGHNYEINLQQEPQNIYPQENRYHSRRPYLVRHQNKQPLNQHQYGTIMVPERPRGLQMTPNIIHYSRPYYQNQNHQPEGFKKNNFMVLTNHQQLQHSYSQNEFSLDYNERPQAIHEVPAPVLSDGRHRERVPYLPKIEPTPLPVTYANSVDDSVIYHQPSSGTIPVVPGVWLGDQSSTRNQVEEISGSLNNIMIKPLVSYGPEYSKGQVDSVPNDPSLDENTGSYNIIDSSEQNHQYLANNAQQPENIIYGSNGKNFLIDTGDMRLEEETSPNNRQSLLNSEEMFDHNVDYVNTNRQVDEQPLYRFEPMKLHQMGQIKRSRQRNIPMDYIILIKEKIIE